MYAIIATGGKQYKVAEGDVIRVEKLGAEAGETVKMCIRDRYKAYRKAGKSKKEFLERAAEIPGIYVPAFYDVEYHEDGTCLLYTSKLQKR